MKRKLHQKAALVLLSATIAFAMTFQMFPAAIWAESSQPPNVSLPDSETSSAVSSSVADEAGSSGLIDMPEEQPVNSGTELNESQSSQPNTEDSSIVKGALDEIPADEKPDEAGLPIEPESLLEAAANEIIIENDILKVVLSDSYPQIKQYEWKDGAKILYGREEPLTIVKIDNLNYTPSVVAESDGATATYTLDFSATALSDVKITMQFALENNVVTMSVTEIIDPQARVRYLEFPDQGLVSVRSTQEGAAMAYNANFANGDTFLAVADAPVTSAAKIGHVILNTNELAASIESDMTNQYNRIQTKQASGYKETSIWNTDFMYRGPDKSVTELPWCKIVITDDCNKDGTVNWQDGAVAYRSIMDPLSGENLARKTIAVNILLNYWGRQSWTWENGLDYVKRQALATDNFPQIMLVKGAHNQYGDGWPSYGDANPLLGGNDALRWLIEEGAKYNVYVGTHTNSVEAYPESPYYESTPKYQGGVWDFVDRGGTAVDDIEYWRNGQLDSNYEKHKAEFPDMKFQYLDVSAGRWDGKEARWTTWKTLKKFEEMDWTYFTEMYLGYVDYTLNSTTTNALSPKYVNWCHTYFYGGESNGGNHGNSDIRRFIINDKAIYEAGNKDFQNVLGPGYQKSYGYLGWSESQTTVQGAVSEFWQHTLADTYLKNFPVLSIKKDEQNNQYLTAVFEDGVTSVFDGSKRTISKNGITYAVLNDTEQDIFIPWEPVSEEKIYTYRTSGGEKQWELPESWNNVNSIYLYKLDETNGKTLVSTIDVTGGQVTIPYEAKQGYVITKAEVSQSPTVWGDGSQLRDGNFNSNSLSVWTAENPSLASVDSSKGNFFLKATGETSVKQNITGLTENKEYVVTALMYGTENRKAKLSVKSGAEEHHAEYIGINTKTVMGNAFNGWNLVKTHFTALSDSAEVSLSALAGSGEVYFDDIRLYEETNPYGAEGYYYKDNMETSHMMGPFVHENGEMARLANANNGVNKNVKINGEKSILMGGKYHSRIKTLPSTLKLDANTGYDLSFSYKSAYGPATGWKVSVLSLSNNKVIVNKYLTGYEGQIGNFKISFKTDSSEDYVIVLDNQKANAMHKSDMSFDDLTLDVNPDAENGPLDNDDLKQDPNVLVEAEEAVISGSAYKVQDADASAGYAVSSFQNGDTLTFTNMIAAKKMRIKYKSSSSRDQKLGLNVNGVDVQDIILPPTEEGKYENKYFDVDVTDASTLVFTASDVDSLFLDLISMNPLYEAEKSSRTGYNGTITDAGASGGQFVWMNDYQNQNTKMAFTMLSDSTKLTVRHANELSRNRYLSIFVNGAAVQENIVFEPTGTRFTFKDVSFDVALSKGDLLELRAPAGQADVAMVDCIYTDIDESKLPSSVQLDKQILEFNGEISQKLNATVLPETATVKSVAWATSNPEVVKVSDGVVMAIGKGEATVTASVSSGKYTAVCDVVVNKAPSLVGWKEAESGERGINSYVSGTTRSAIGEELVWLNGVNWSTQEIQDAWCKFVVPYDAKAIQLRYANQNTSNRYIDIFINDSKVIDNMAFGKTGDGIVCAETRILLDLKKGDVLKFAAPTGQRDVLMLDKFAYVIEVDTTNLQTEITGAEAITQGNYTQASWDALQQVISRAKTMLDGTSSTQQELDDILQQIKDAVSQLTVKSVPVESVTLDKTSLNIEVNQSAQLTSLVLPANADNKTVVWSTNNASVATVSSGLVKAVSAGTAVITAEADGKTASCTVVVNKPAEIPVSSISVAPATATLKKGESTVLKAAVLPANATNPTVVWTSSNVKVATVDASGKVTAVSGGSATITAAAGGKSAVSKITVTVAVSKVKLNKTRISLNAKGSYALKAVITPEDATNNKVTWKSSNTKIATVSSKGVISAKKAGTAVITVKTSDGGKTATCKVTVKNEVSKLEISKKSVSLKKNQSTALKVYFSPKNVGGTYVAWTSSKPKVASVSESGKVKALAKGTAIITAKAGNKKVTCKVTVK